jgi:hypothetical protein
VPGCEISTDDGHLLALFIHKPVPAGLSWLKPFCVFVIRVVYALPLTPWHAAPQPEF